MEIFSGVSETLYHVGGVILLHLGALGQGLLVLLIGSILARGLNRVATGSPEDVQFGNGIYFGIKKSLIGAIIQGAVPIALAGISLWVANRIIQVNFPGFSLF